MTSGAEDRVTRALRLQSEEHPLEGVQEPTTLAEHCLQLMHLKAYEEIVPRIAGRVVLDLGCNTGYGTSLISRAAEKTVGLDVSLRAINAAQSAFADSRVDFRVFDGRAIPFADGYFDSVVSCQVIEHVPDVPAYLAEIARVLVPGGLAIFTTPNGAIRIDPDVGPWNRFHLREYTAAGLQEALIAHFHETAVSGLFAVPPVYEVEMSRCRQARAIARWRAGKASPIRSRADLLHALSGTAMRLLPERAVSSIRQFGSRLSRTKPFPRFSTDDFFYQDEGIDAALDLMAICRLGPCVHGKQA